jgi:hypothetical protein
MDTPERSQEIADFLTKHGYKVKPTDDYLTNLATRLRNAGYEVEDPDDDDGAQARTNAGADQPASERTARRATNAAAAKGDAGAGATRTTRTESTTPAKQ